MRYDFCIQWRIFFIVSCAENMWFSPRILRIYDLSTDPCQGQNATLNQRVLGSSPKWRSFAEAGRGKQNRAQVRTEQGVTIHSTRHVASRGEQRKIALSAKVTLVVTPVEAIGDARCVSPMEALMLAFVQPSP